MYPPLAHVLFTVASISLSPLGLGGADGARTAFPVDFVYCWSGVATQWGSARSLSAVEMLRLALSLETLDPDEHNTGMGFDELWYSIRSLEQFAPWIRRIYILVDPPAQAPAWVLPHSRIAMVDRCALFPKREDCPTHNTAACQSVMHRIPGLMEHFVAMEDDNLLTRRVEPSDFFTADGRPLIVQAGTDHLVKIYGKGELHGPDMPPTRQPVRTNDIRHFPVPMRVSFSYTLEHNFADWFRFVRSHKNRFRCCNASQASNGLDEDFTRVYPAMLRKMGKGVVRVPPDNYCDCNAPNHCLVRTFRNPEQMFALVNNCKSGKDARDAFSRLDRLLGPPLGLLLCAGPCPQTGAAAAAASAAALTLSRISCVALALLAAGVLLLACAPGQRAAQGLLRLVWGGPASPPSAAAASPVAGAGAKWAYIMLACAHPFVQREAGWSGYSLAAAALLAHCLRLAPHAVAAAGHLPPLLSLGVGRGPPQDEASALAEHAPRRGPALVFGGPGAAPGPFEVAFLMAALPGAAAACFGVLSLAAMARLDPVTYQVYLNMQFVLAALLSTSMFGRCLQEYHWVGLALFVFAGAVKAADDVTQHGVLALSGLACSAGQVCVGGVGAIARQRLLRAAELRGLQPSLLEACTHLWAVLWLLLALTCGAGGGGFITGLGYALMGLDAWKRLFRDGGMILSIVCLAAAGIAADHVAKGVPDEREFLRHRAPVVVLTAAAAGLPLLLVTPLSAPGVLAAAAAAAGAAAASPGAWGGAAPDHHERKPLLAPLTPGGYHRGSRPKQQQPDVAGAVGF